METDFDEDLSKLSKVEVIERKQKLARDKRYVNYKVIYWSKLYKHIRDYEYKLIKREEELKGLCEICGIRTDNSEKLRSLPDGRRVCKKCWTVVIDDILRRNRKDEMSNKLTLKVIETKDIDTMEENK